MEKKKFKKNLPVIGITAFFSVIITLMVICFYFKSLPVPLVNIINTGRIIESSYVGDFDSKKAEEDMMKAMVNGLDDKYAVYYDEENAKETFQIIDGHYIGIGLEVFANPDSNKIEVISAYKDTPAYKAGLKKGDCIVKIDKQAYDAESLAEAVIYMKGTKEKNPLEKEITLTIEREGELFDCKIKRAKIDLYKVESEILDGICYIRYSGFTQSATDEVEKIISTLNNVDGVIVDVRNNPGGELDSAIKLCDLFLDDEMIMYTVDKNGNKQEYNAEKGKCDLPLAIIVNGSSASAAEVFAGSLQANDRAVIVGEKTYGKGVTQTVQYVNPRDLSAGAIKLTTHKNYTPDGRWINESIIPDVKVNCEDVSDINTDSAFTVAVDTLKKDSLK